MLIGTQCVAARALLRWKQVDLSAAIKAGGGQLSVTAITAFERGGSIRQSNADLIEAAFVQAGVLLIPENGGGAGVRLRKPAVPDDTKPISGDRGATDVFDYIERFYNPVRRHSTIGYLSPIVYEERAMKA